MIRVLVFDWGDTVMRVFPEYKGPMAHWPRVEAVPGVEDALRTLYLRYQLALATNAAESGCDLVRAALQRIGLDAYFDCVFTAREMGASKPEPAFFRAVLGELGCAPHEAIMIGDNYRVDVVGAKEASMRAIWFNPTTSACPVVHPLHDGEARTMTELAATAQDRYMPDMTECLTLLAEQDVPPHTVRHSQTVAAIAFRLATWLKEYGATVNPLLAHRGGLLHDLAKITSQGLNQSHGQVGAQALREQGYPELASVIQRHSIFSIRDPTRRPVTWEEKLVYYADKIVEGDRVVGAQKRLEDLCRLFPQSAEEIRYCLPFITALEAEICAGLGVSSIEEIISDVGGGK